MLAKRWNREQIGDGQRCGNDACHRFIDRRGSRVEDGAGGGGGGDWVHREMRAVDWMCDQGL